MWLGLGTPCGHEISLRGGVDDPLPRSQRSAVIWRLNGGCAGRDNEGDHRELQLTTHVTCLPLIFELPLSFETTIVPDTFRRDAQ